VFFPHKSWILPYRRAGIKPPAQKTGIVKEKSEQEQLALEKSAVETPAGIPIMEISDGAKETHIILNKIKVNIKPDSDILTVEEQLSQFLYSLKKLRSGWF